MELFADYISLKTRRPEFIEMAYRKIAPHLYLDAYKQ